MTWRVLFAKRVRPPDSARSARTAGTFAPGWCRARRTSSARSRRRACAAQTRSACGEQAGRRRWSHDAGGQCRGAIRADKSQPLPIEEISRPWRHGFAPQLAPADGRRSMRHESEKETGPRAALAVACANFANNSQLNPGSVHTWNCSPHCSLLTNLSRLSGFFKPDDCP